jgi:hypothetical protein
MHTRLFVRAKSIKSRNSTNGANETATQYLTQSDKVQSKGPKLEFQRPYKLLKGKVQQLKNKECSLQLSIL